MSPVKDLSQSTKDGKEYDYVICGGGTSGCVVARRLAEQAASPDSSVPSILLVEAGPSHAGIHASHMPGGVFSLMGSEVDWQTQTVPQEHLNGRVLPLTRGKMLGGSSAMNGTLCIRGHRRNWDEWGIEGWGGREMFGYMRKAETFHGKEWFNAASDEHGMEGPLHTEPYDLDLAPISKLLMDSMADKGMPRTDDLFATGETPMGCGHAVRTVHNGVRTTSADFLAGFEDKIDVLVGTMVDKVILEERDGELAVTGVEVVDCATKERRIVRARREVILSGGTYCSPTILLRSGIGPKSEVEKHGIDSRVDLPGVGKNLVDHLVAFASYEVNKPGLTLDAQIHHEGGAMQSLKQYQDTQTGAFAAFPFGAFAFARLDERLDDEPMWWDAPREKGRDPTDVYPDQAHVEYMHFNMLSGHLTGLPDPKDQRHGFDFMTLLFCQKSRGTVELKSEDPFDNPVIDPHYLEDPLDVLVLSEGVRLGNEIVMQGKGTKGVVKGPFPADSKHHTWNNREDWVEFVRNNCHTAYHPAGTCKMGKEGDEMAVVDERLRVRGVKGLRVADCSIMPTLTGGHTQMPAYAIGEKAADLIKEDWKL